MNVSIQSPPMAKPSIGLTIYHYALHCTPHLTSPLGLTGKMFLFFSFPFLSFSHPRLFPAYTETGQPEGSMYMF